MNQNRWILPEGIDELLPVDAALLESLRRELTDLCLSWGYELIMPPFIEYLDSLLTGTGHESDLQTFKLVDQLNGRMMGVRSDMTPQIARIDAHRLGHTDVSRLFYMGTTLRTRPDGLSGSRSPLQLGAEIYGHAGAQSDVEIISLMLAILRHCAADQALYLDLGHVGIFRGLARQAGLDADQEALLFDMMQRKSVPEVSGFVEQNIADRALGSMFRTMVTLSGGEDVLQQAAEVFAAAGDPVKEALAELQHISRLLHEREDALQIHFDLSELRGYSYHTGVVFAAYINNQGQETARGGRYDDIGECFGRSRPATGFSTDLKQLAALLAARRAGNEKRKAIYVPDTSLAGVWDEINRLRHAGEIVACALSDAVPESDTLCFDRQLVKDNGTWKLKDYKHGE
ncbi:MAG: ATP phosphoribosyltransferase regulatory subunit [Gammaproteobacteria bacterium]|nr:ATP phosphoribosyltransferase regulatory subunit [Gammaproteobacteria bacterium]